MKIKGLLLVILIAVTSSLIAQENKVIEQKRHKVKAVNAPVDGSQQDQVTSQPVMLEDLSSVGFAETVEKITQAATASGWKVLITHDLQETMKKNGKEVLPVKVMELCNPQLAYQILSNEEQRAVGVFLPCRISVYEKSDGKTYISRMNSPAFGGMIGGKAAIVINEAFTQAEKFVEAAVTSSKQ